MPKSEARRIEETTKIPMGTYVTIHTKNRLQEYLAYMKKPTTNRKPESDDWPKTMTEVVEEALNMFLSEHLTTSRPPALRKK